MVAWEAVMATHASWVHGTAFMPAEQPEAGLDEVDGIKWTDVVGLRRGWGSFWQGVPNGANWFHVSIPTPVIVAGARARLEKVFVMWIAGDPSVSFGPNAGANVTDVHVWDGPTRILRRTGMLLAGDHRTRLDTDNQFAIPNTPEVRWGVGISVRVQFSQAQQVGFASAGADFMLP